ncbi:O-antigen ligase [Saliphagus sp. LR7]|uniref:O-antigen ligase family protein n=1 Tax=Saliphagus sp. LR7 TaxID=2282654 RepID=UPI000DF73A03|nr:O-antigen ligase family protein [Saliphagus sp. LR7]
MDSSRRADAAFAVCYVAFVFAGVYKDAWYVAWAPLDLTLAFGLAAAAVAGWLALRGRLRVTRAGIVITGLFTAFALYAVVSGIWSPSTDYYLSKAFRLVGVTGLTLGLGALVVASSARRLRYTGFATVGFSLVAVVETFVRYLQSGDTAIYPFGTNYLITGRVLGLGIVILTGYLVLSRADRRLTTAAGIVLPPATYALLVIGSRGPLVAAVGAIGLLVVAGLLIGRLPNGRWALGAYAAAVGLAGYVAFTVARHLETITRLLWLLEGPGQSLGARFTYWQQTIAGLGPATLPFGHGLGSWPVVLGYGDAQDYPHNILLEVAFELGLVGLALLLSLFAVGVGVAIREWADHGRPVHLVLLALFAYMLANTMVTGDLNENRYLFAVCGVLAYRVAPRRYAVPSLATVREAIGSSGSPT